MEELLQKRFDALEAAFTRLLESITTYNPSVQAAQDLLAADADLNEGFELLARHQANYKRILALQQTADQLDNQVKNTIKTIADTRTALLTAPFAASEETGRDLPVDEILSYARRIAPYTVPPEGLSATPVEEVPKQDVAMAVLLANGTAASSAPATGENTGTQTPADTQPHHPTDSQTSGLGNMMGDLKNILNEQKTVQFVPWPDGNRIQASGLMAVQHLFGLKPAPIEAETKEGQLPEETQVRIKEEEMGDGPRLESGRVEEYANAAPQTRKQEEFRGFALYDEDED